MHNGVTGMKKSSILNSRLQGMYRVVKRYSPSFEERLVISDSRQAARVFCWFHLRKKLKKRCGQEFRFVDSYLEENPLIIETIAGIQAKVTGQLYPLHFAALGKQHDDYTLQPTHEISVCCRTSFSIQKWHFISQDCQKTSQLNRELFSKT